MTEITDFLIERSGQLRLGIDEAAMAEARYVNANARNEAQFDLVKTQFEKAQEAGGKVFAGYLNELSGIGVVAITGQVYIPETTRAFGDWIVKQDGNGNFNLTDSEEICSSGVWPKDPHEVEFLIRGAQLIGSGSGLDSLIVTVERFVEDGEPRVVYPELVERFELVELVGSNILDEREDRYVAGAIRLADAIQEFERVVESN